MHKKYKIKKRRKFISPYLVFIVFAVCVVAISVGYSLFSDTLKFDINANILESYGNSTYSWNHLYSWGGNGEPYFYQLTIDLTNLDESYDYWDLTVELPKGFSIVSSDMWQAEYATINGNFATLHSKSWAGSIPYGETYNYNLILAFDNPVNIEIVNVFLNGKRARLLEPVIPTVGKSTYNWNLITSWGGNGSYSYQINFDLTNLDKSCTSWELKFDVPDGFLVSSNIWQASSISLDGNTVTLIASAWCGSIALGETFNGSFILSFDRKVDFNISNVIFNGLPANEI